MTAIAVTAIAVTAIAVTAHHAHVGDAFIVFIIAAAIATGGTSYIVVAVVTVIFEDASDLAFFQNIW